MTDDDLNAPLGQNIKKRPFRLPVRPSHVAAGVLAVFIGSAATWAVLVDDPLGGEPIAVAPTGFDSPKHAMPVAVSGGAPAQGPRIYDGPSANPATPETVTPVPPAAPAGGRTVTIIDGSTGRRQEVPISSSGDNRASGEQRLLEMTRYGAIPKIAPDGVRPADAYASPMKVPRGRPQVAIIVTGLGTSTVATQRAMEKLPAAVTFALMPYNPETEGLANKAHAAGHELLLQAPMEPFDYPDNDPGPQTLLSTLSGEQNLDRLTWLMSRFQGYVGIINMMGARFTSNENALAPVVKETAKRGLIYVDDGSSPRSVAGQIANANNLSFAKGEVALDSVSTSSNIDKALARLEALAREHGGAVGTTSALPVSIDRISEWAKGAESRGIALVPITAIALKPKSS